MSPAAFWSDPFNVAFLIAVAAAALLFTGAGRYSVDAGIFGSWRFGVRVALGLLVLAIAAAVLTWILLNGANPIHFTAPAA
jgi:putative oxidoreductase